MSLNKFNQEYRYHHMGIPITEVRPNEKFSEAFGMYTSDVDGDFRIQYHRFTEDSPLHPLIKTVPHVAIQVDNLDEAEPEQISKHFLEDLERLTSLNSETN